MLFNEREISFTDIESGHHLETSSYTMFFTDPRNFHGIGMSSSSVDAIASDGLQDDLITIAIDKENSLADDKA